jgi:hypothetical protein
MSNKVRTNNTLTDSSANAGAEGAIAQGSNARFAQVGANQITVSGGGDVKVSDSSPEVLAAAFNFGRDALTALQSNTERQVSGAVDAARQATEAASRLASGDSANAANAAADSAKAAAAEPPSNPLALSPLKIGLLVAAALAAFFFFGRKK